MAPHQTVPSIATPSVPQTWSHHPCSECSYYRSTSVLLPSLQPAFAVLLSRDGVCFPCSQSCWSRAWATWPWSSSSVKWGRQRCPLYFLKKHLFIWLCRVLVAALGILSCCVRSLSCGMWGLVPWPGIKPGPPALGVRSLSHWTTREVLAPDFRGLLWK